MSKTIQDLPTLRRKPKEGHREEKGGHKNLLREAEEEQMEAFEEAMAYLQTLEED